MSPRSSRNFVQHGFIPKWPLPDLPHKNSKNTDALHLAKLWGCEMRVVNSNDIGVSHQLIENGLGQRGGLSVSISRNDTSQALVSFLRKVRDRVLETVKEPDMAVQTTNSGLIVRPAENNTPKSQGRYIPTIEEDLEAVVPAAPIQPPFPMGKPKSDPAPDPRSYLTSLAQFFHYRHHCSDGHHTPFLLCGECAQVRRELADIVTTAERDRLLADLQAAQSLLDQAALAAVPPKPSNAPEGIKPDGLTMGDSTGIFPAGIWITPDDDADKRGEKYDMMVDILRASLGRVDRRLDRGVLDAISQAIQRNGYDREWEVGFRILNFNRFRAKIQQQVRPGLTRKMVGNVRWMEFQRAMEKLRFQTVGRTSDPLLSNSAS